MREKPYSLGSMNRRERRKQAKHEKKRVAEKPSATAGLRAELDRAFDAAVDAQAGGRTAEAEAACRAIVAREPNHAPAINLLGILQCQRGDAEAGARLIERAIALEPEEASFHNNLGTALSSLGRKADALAAYERALARKPDYAQALNNAGTVLRALGRFQDSAARYERVLALQPDWGEAYSNYGNALLDLERVEEAVAAFRKALAINPKHSFARNNLGNALKRLGAYGDAIQAYERAVALAPGYADAHNNLAEALKEMGQGDAAVAAYRRALACAPSNFGDAAGMGSNLLLALNAVDGYDALAVFAEHRRWAERFANALVPSKPSFPNRPDPDRRLRVGYISPDFRRHSVAYFIEPVLEAHDRNQVEVTCYASLAKADAVTERLKRLAGQWRDIYGVDDGRVADAIREDAIDILVDLGGHTGGSRLMVLARRPAPVQATWLGYPNTTGLTTVDYRLTDAAADPPGAEAGYVETPVRLDGGFLCYRPPADAPEVGPLPADENGFIRFAYCNNLSKMTDRAIAAWAEVLNRVPGSRLLLKAKPFAWEGARALVARRFQAHGIAPDRLDLLGWVTEGTHLAAYGRIDIGLDTFPYNGTTTTCEALWMGVPVVTLRGDRHAGRVGASLLSKIGLDDLITAAPEAYVETAVGLARDLPRLRALRRDLRGRIAASGLTDAAAFTRTLEAAYRRMWRAWCGRENP
ncbi:MAG: tetratricopeptide repeat protein [Rhodospirillales bacterium]|nr:tetratricopeptide repeat protein [Rhodospirillales bacterium]